jgi:hypothetical protein
VRRRCSGQSSRHLAGSAASAASESQSAGRSSGSCHVEELDESFYRLAEQRDLVGQYATAYVSAHRDEFPA